MDVMCCDNVVNEMCEIFVTCCDDEVNEMCEIFVTCFICSTSVDASSD